VRTFLVVLIALLLLAPAPAAAWSYKGHVLLTRIAAQRILENPATPDELKEFVRAYCPEAQGFNLEEFVLNTHIGPDPSGISGLSYWAMHPDMARREKVPAFDSTEAKMHFLDLELLHPKQDNRQYASDLSGLPELADVPRDVTDERYQDAGYLPFRVEQCYDAMVVALRAGDQEAAVRWAGYLAHYVQDNTQPQHATVDYRSHSYFPDVRRQSRPNVHAWVEYSLLDDGQPSEFMKIRKEMVERMKAEAKERPPVEPANLVGDPWALSVMYSRDAYKYLPMIGQGALAATANGGEPDLTKFAYYVGENDLSVLDMKAQQMMYAAFLTEAMWRQAWEEAAGRYVRKPEYRTPNLALPTTRPAG
jgi:hypothetical protein